MKTFLIIIGALVALTIAAALFSRGKKQPQGRALDEKRDWTAEAKRLQAKHSTARDPAPAPATAPIASPDPEPRRRSSGLPPKRPQPPQKPARPEPEKDDDDQPVTLSPLPERPGALEAFPCAVVGESHRNRDGSSRQEIIRQFVTVGQPVTLRREPDNPHDRNAVAVLCSGQQVGYLSRDMAARLAEQLDDQAFRVEVRVLGVYGGTRNKPSRGVTLDVGIYETGLPSNSPDTLLQQATEIGQRARAAAKSGDYAQARSLYGEQRAALARYRERVGAEAGQEASVFAPLHQGLADLLRLEKRHTEALPHILFWVIAGRQKPLKAHADKLRAHFNRCKLQHTTLAEVEAFAAQAPADISAIETQVQTWLRHG